MIRAIAALVLLLAGQAWPAAAQSPAEPGPTLERVRQRGVVACGSAIRPGLAFPAIDHVWHGLHVELCRAVAAAVLGDPGKIEFHGYALRPDFARIGAGTDDVAFLTTTELFTNGLFGAVLPGPTVFRLPTQVMVWESSPVQHVSALGRTMVCVEPGTGAERSLMAYAAAQHWDANVSPWMELEEMMDAYGVGRCPAVVGEATALAAVRLGAAESGHASRLLPEPLAVAPVMAATAAADPRWSIMVRWVVGTVLAHDAGPDRLVIPGAALGLDAGWQQRVRALGSYTALFERTLGRDSVLELPLGANGTWREGGQRVPPSID